MNSFDTLDTFGIFSNLLGLNAALLGVTVTLIALVPTLLELISLKYPSFLSGEFTRKRLNQGIVELSRSIWLFGIAASLSIVGLLWQHIVLLIAVIALSFLGIFVIIRIGQLVATIVTSVT